MSKDKNRDQQPPAADGKPRYSTPKILTLGELARGVGGCQNGSAPQGSCGTGVGLTGTDDCHSGAGAVVRCRSGQGN